MRTRFSSCLAVLALAALPGLASAQGSGFLVLQTNAAGDNIHVIDGATHTVVGQIKGIEVSHGIKSAPDGSRYYISNEPENTLDVVDAKSLTRIQQIPLSGRPNNIAITKDGRKVYVGIIAPDFVDVIDTATLKKTASIPTRGGIHNVYVTPDSKYAVAGSIAGRNIMVIDVATDRPEWMLFFDQGVRPLAFETKPGGATNRIFVQVSGFAGFYIVDFDQRREVGRVNHPDFPGEHSVQGGSVSHGAEVSPDGKLLYVASKATGHVLSYSLPDLKLLGTLQVGHHPDWLTFSPDGRYVYVANAGSNYMSVIDAQAIREVKRVPVGQVPKRNTIAPRMAAAGTR
jgi:YVTN family beta-propeller protein